MSKVYVLLTEDRGYNVEVFKVFSSYASLLSWLDAKYEGTVLKDSDDQSKDFWLVLETLDYKLYCEIHDLIGETSHKTDKLVIKGE